MTIADFLSIAPKSQLENSGFKPPNPEETFEELKKSLERSKKHMPHQDFKGIFAKTA